MKKQTRFINARRRGFLKGAAAAGTAAATGGAVAAPPLPELDAPAAAAPQSQGYRATDHVRTYYDRARF